MATKTDGKSVRKSDRRHAEALEKKSHTDVVEVERNLIEQGLLATRHWMHANRQTVRWGLIGIISFFVLVLAFIFFHSMMVENHNAQVYFLMKDYDQARLISVPALKKAKMKDVESGASQLCHNFYPTRESYYSCIVAALAAREKNDGNPGKAMAPYLQRFADHYDNDGPGSFFTFYTAYAFEAAGDFSTAILYYKKWGEYLKDNELQSQEAALYHQMRNLYYSGDKKGALELCNKIIKDYPQSIYMKKSLEYRYLIFIKNDP